jgi:hypothetical protein
VCSHGHCTCTTHEDCADTAYETVATPYCDSGMCLNAPTADSPRRLGDGPIDPGCSVGTPCGGGFLGLYCYPGFCGLPGDNWCNTGHCGCRVDADCSNTWFESSETPICSNCGTCGTSKYFFSCDAGGIAAVATVTPVVAVVIIVLIAVYAPCCKCCYTCCKCCCCCCDACAPPNPTEAPAVHKHEPGATAATVPGRALTKSGAAGVMIGTVAVS